MTIPYTKRSTPLRILKAAEQTFASKGFKGSSMKEIAEKAGVNKSLIYHHFENKDSLWRTVKANLTQSRSEQSNGQTIFNSCSFFDFLKNFISLRVEFYDQNPTFSRLMTWHRLEQSTENQEAIGEQHILNIIKQIKDFQNKGEVRADLEPELVSCVIMSSTLAPFIVCPEHLQDTHDFKMRYVDLITEGFYQVFAKQKGQDRRDRTP